MRDVENENWNGEKERPNPRDGLSNIMRYASSMDKKVIR